MNIYSEYFIFCQISFLKYLDLLKICSKKDSFYEYSYITFSFGFFKYIPETYQFLQRSYKILKYPPLNPMLAQMPPQEQFAAFRFSGRL